MRDYELVYIVNPQTDQEGLNAVNERVTSLIETSGGSVHEVKPWGQRRLAYPIKNHREGQYVLMEIGLPPQGVNQLERGLKLNELIIRHLVVRVDED